MQRPIIMTSDGKVRPGQVKISASKAYTVGELRELANDYLHHYASSVSPSHVRIVTAFLDHVEKQEKTNG